MKRWSAFRNPIPTVWDRRDRMRFSCARRATKPRGGVTAWGVGLLMAAVPLTAAPPEWPSHRVNLQLTGGARITRIAFPPPAKGVASAEADDQGPLPIGGFEAFVAILGTNDTEPGFIGFDTVPKPSLSGQVFANDPTKDFAIGRLDLGAPLHIINLEDSERLALRSGFNPPVPGSSPIPIGGCAPLASRPMGLFVAGLGAIDPADNTLDTSRMVGQSNVSIAVGDPGGCISGTLPTVVGMPLAMFYCFSIHNDDWQFIRRDGNQYFGPKINFFTPFDPAIPRLAHRIPATFLPVGQALAFYFPGFLDDNPLLPTIVDPGRLMVNVRFRHGENQTSSVPMVFDSGAQAGIMSFALAAELGLDFSRPDFMVDVLRVGGLDEDVPGFFVEEASFPVLAPTRLKFNRVPFLVLNVGLENGLFGNNVFDNRNLVVCPDAINAYIDVSEPLGLSRFDLTRDRAVDRDDVELFQEVLSGPGEDDITFLPADYDVDFDIDLDDWAFLAPNILLAEGETRPLAVEIVADGPVLLAVTSPAGRRLSELEAGIVGAIHTLFDHDDDGVVEAVVQMVTFETGTYRVDVEPRPGASGRSTFTLHAVVNGRTIVLAENVRLSDIPAEAYALVVDLTVPGDFDADGDIDLADVVRFLSCFSGAGQAFDTGCAAADLDGDGDSDLADFLALQELVTGSR